jgi:hypothetical protein
MRTQEGQTVIEFSLLFSLIFLMGLTLLTAVHHRLAGFTAGIGGPGP